MSPSKTGALWVLIFCTNLELILLVLCMFPDVTLAFVYVALSGSIAVGGGAVGFFVFFFVVGLLFSYFRDVSSLPKAEAIPMEFRAEVDHSLHGLWRDGRSFPMDRVIVVPADLSVGARVSGLVKPIVVISGGLLYGLTQHDPLSRAVVAHEIGHIRNGDRWIFGLIVVTVGLSAISLLSPIQIFSWPDLLEHSSKSTQSWFLYLSAAFKLVLLSAIIHWREYAADAVGARLIGSKVEYLKLLYLLYQQEPDKSGSGSRHGAAFHPTIGQRIRQLAQRRSAIGPRVGLTVLWISLLCLSIVTCTGVGGGDFGHQDLAISSLALVCLTGLLAEAVKAWAFERDKAFHKAVVLPPSVA
jgi:Zn-dependent protease with chaperone function